MMIAWASVQDLGTVFSFSDLTMALLAITNLLALWYLAPIGMKLLKDFEAQLRGVLHLCLSVRRCLRRRLTRKLVLIA